MEAQSLPGINREAMLAQAQMMPPDLGQLLQNVAVVPDGIELAFVGDRCGKSYRIKRNCIKSWDVYFNDWHEGGWVELRNYGSSFQRHDAIETCNRHAIEHRLIKFLPHRAKFKPNPALWGWGMAAQFAGQIAAVAGLSI